MKDILVTIITPVYNGEQSISKCINSILNQTHKNIELLVVNDGSTDKTGEIVKKIKKNDIRIKYFEIENSGVSSARNIGLDNARGDYVGFVDADDYIDNKMIEILLETIISYESDIVSCIYEQIIGDKSVLGESELKSGYYDKNSLKKHVYPNLLGDYDSSYKLPLSLWTKLFSNKLIQDNSQRFNTNLKFGEDLLFTSEFLLHSNSFYFIDDLPLYKYKHNDQSVTSKYYPNKWEELKKTIIARKNIVNNFPEYRLEEYYYYSVLSSGINAIFNVFKNNTNGSLAKIKELSQILNDPLLVSALDRIELRKLNSKVIILAFLLKNKKLYTMYYLLELYGIVKS